MDTKLVYHVVTDKPMRLGQHILTKITFMPNSQNCPPIKEFLVDGDIEVVEIMRKINKNLS